MSKESNRIKMAKWRASLSPEDRTAMNARSNALRKQRMEKDETLVERHRKEAKAYYWRMKEKDPSWKPMRNRPHINEQKRVKYYTDPVYNITAKLRARLRIALRKQGVRTHRSSTRDLLGMSFTDFQRYIESLFQSGMGWGNYGHNNSDGIKRWHIDHIRPCASFDLTDLEQQKQCFHYTNMRPMWSSENFSKNSLYNGIVIRKRNGA